MKFKRLEINDWKQFEDVQIDFHNRLTVLTGANGSGKTTILHLLAKTFGWRYNELATPSKDNEKGNFKYIIKRFKHIFVGDNNENNNIIGKLELNNKSYYDLKIPANTNSIYNIEMQYIGQNNEHVQGLNISAYRNEFKYQNIQSVTTTKRKRSDVHSQTDSRLKDATYSNRSYDINNIIKENLITWVIQGCGNKYMQADEESMRNFEGFQNVLKNILPQNIGFKKINIINCEIVLETTSGDFMLDSVSGGIASLIELAWQIYNIDYDKESDIIVLIDEIENHLHAEMQRNVLPNLINAFPNIQFVVSTHSPLVVSSVKDSNVYAFRYNIGHRVYSEKLDLVNKARSATEILNEVLGVPFTMPIWAEDSLNRLLEKYKAIEISKESIEAMREDFKKEGLESLMPIALTKIID